VLANCGWLVEIIKRSDDKQEAAPRRKKLGLDLRHTADRIAWLKHQAAQEEKPE